MAAPIRSDFRQEVTGLAQTGARREWLSREADYMREQGATWLRVTHKPDDVSHLVLEGWYKRPHSDLMPDPPWNEPFTSHDIP